MYKFTRGLEVFWVGLAYLKWIFVSSITLSFHLVFLLFLPIRVHSFPPPHISHTFLDNIIPECHTLFVAIVSKPFFIGILVGFACIKELLYIDIVGYFMKLLVR